MQNSVPVLLGYTVTAPSGILGGLNKPLGPRMSQLQLNGKIVNDIRTVLSQHDPAAQDPGVASQYLSAIIGFLLGQEESMSEPQKQETLQELLAFAGQVAADVSQQKSAQMQSASGVWKPGMP